MALLQEVNPYIEAERFVGMDGALQSRRVVGGLDLNFQPDGELKLEVNDWFDRLDRTFTPFPGRSIPVGRYNYRNATATYTSTQRYSVYGNAGVQVGDFYNGTNTTLSGGLTWRPRYDISFEGTYQHNDVSLPSGAFAAEIAPVSVKVPVRWADLDANGHVNNAKYFTYFEQARIAWLESQNAQNAAGQGLNGQGFLTSLTSASTTLSSCGLSAPASAEGAAPAACWACMLA